jgi:hypothetical protein
MDGNQENGQLEKRDKPVAILRGRIDRGHFQRFKPANY